MTSSEGDRSSKGVPRAPAQKSQRKKNGKDARISDYTVRRLSVYYRILEDLLRDGEEVVSSEKLAKLAGTNSAQVRKDLSYFGNFGKRGRGYQVVSLRDRIRAILGLNRRWRVVLVGAGNLGTALYSYRDFESHGFQIVAILDSDPSKIGQDWGGVRVAAIEECESVIRATQAEVAVVVTPATVAQSVVNRLSAAGIRGFLNFAPRKLEVPPGVELRNVNITIELEGLSFALHAPAAEPPAGPSETDESA